MSLVCLCELLSNNSDDSDERKMESAFEPDAGWLFWVSFIVGFGERITIVLVKASVCLCVCARTCAASLCSDSSSLQSEN